MREFSGDELLGLPVRLHGIELGRPVDVLLDRESMRVIGLDVLCGDEVHRFLPLPTAAVGRDELTIHSSLVLLEEDELDFYRARALALSSLRGRSVEHGGRAAGSLRDVVLAATGSLLSVVVEHAGRTERLPFDQSLRIAPEARTAA